MFYWLKSKKILKNNWQPPSHMTYKKYKIQNIKHLKQQMQINRKSAYENQINEMRKINGWKHC